MTPAILPEHGLAAVDIDAIEDRLYDHNRLVTGKSNAQGIAFVIRDQRQSIVAACAGFSWAGSSELKQLWVDAALRGRGYGRELLRAFEAEAANRDVTQIWVATYDFQAPGFYETAGFKRMAEFVGWPVAHSNIILCKNLSSRHGI